MSFKTAFFSFMKGQKSQVELESYRRAGAQIDDLEAAIQTQVHAAPLQAGKPPWERPKHQQQALAFAWVSRGLFTTATTLLEIDEKLDPSTAGYLPVVTFLQAKELYIQVPDYIHRTWEALANPRYKSDKPLPLPMGPRMEADGKCPLVHLRGIQAAAQALDGYSQVRFNAYLAAVKATGTPPAEVQKTLDELQQIRARAQSKLGFANDQLATISQGGNVPMSVHEEAETRLWEALSDHFLLGQFLAMPDLLQSASVAGHNATGRIIKREDRWSISDPDAARELKDTKFGEQEIKEFWTEKGWRTTPREERYLAQCEQLLKEGAIAPVSRWSTIPFDSVYRALAPVTVLDMTIDKGVEFHLNMDENEDEMMLGTPTFRRTKGYEEGHDEGHQSDPSGH